jgi:hypothetical protein
MASVQRRHASSRPRASACRQSATSLQSCGVNPKNAFAELNRRQAIRLLTYAPAALLVGRTRAQAVGAYTELGSGPTVLAFNRQPRGYFDALAEHYHVVVIDYPPPNPSAEFLQSFTADRVCADVLAVADAVGADRFAWFGFSWGFVVGLQLAVRTNRLTALVGGGWPPLGGQYRETLAASESRGARGETANYTTFYRSLRAWPERDAVASLQCPRMVFVGTEDEFVAEGRTITHAALIWEHREDLERLGWAVRFVDGFGHELGGRPDVVIPLVREFLDPLLLSRAED